MENQRQMLQFRCDEVKLKIYDFVNTSLEVPLRVSQMMKMALLLVPNSTASMKFEVH